MLPNKEGKKMPPKFKFTREEIIQAALDLTRESGIAAVTARGLGAKLGSSVKPIFSLFENMEEVQNEVLKAAEKLSQAAYGRLWKAVNILLIKPAELRIYASPGKKRSFSSCFICATVPVRHLMRGIP